MASNLENLATFLFVMNIYEANVLSKFLKLESLVNI